MQREQDASKSAGKARRTKAIETHGSSAFGISDYANVALFLAAFIGLWQLAFALNLWPTLPSPASSATKLANLVLDNSLTIGIATTMWRLAAGFTLSIIIGGAVGLVMVKFPGFGKTMSSFAVGLLTFPSIAWVPFAILMIGFSDGGILFVVVMASVFSVMISTYGAMRNVPPVYIRASKNMGASGFALFRHVMIPAATPNLVMGLRQAWSFAWHALIGAEMLITTLDYFQHYGLGHILSVGREFIDMGQIISVMITIFVIGVVFDRVIFLRLEEKVRTKWGLNQHTG